MLGAQDRSGAPRSALVNESYAKRFPHQDPIGQRLDFGPVDGQRYTIVGVVGDVKQSSLSDGETDAIYITPTQWHWMDNPMSLVVRTHGSAAALAPAVRSAIRSVDKNQPIFRVTTMDELVGRSVADRHFALILFEAFGVVALILAAVGIYGVLSSSVTEKVREIGIRAALGASPESILGLILGQGMKLTALGIAIGLIAAAAATRAIVSMLFGVSRLDVVTYLAVVVTLGAVAVIACGLPAWRAARLDPNRALSDRRAGIYPRRSLKCVTMILGGGVNVAAPAELSTMMFDATGVDNKRGRRDRVANDVQRIEFQRSSFAHLGSAARINPRPTTRHVPCTRRHGAGRACQTLCLYVIRPRVRSYGDTSTVTRSPSRIRMRKAAELACDGREDGGSVIKGHAERSARKDFGDGPFEFNQIFFGDTVL